MHLRQILLADRICDGQLARIVGDDILVEEKFTLFGETEKRVENRPRTFFRRGDALDPHGRDLFAFAFGADVLPQIEEHRAVERLAIGLVENENRLFRLFSGDPAHPAVVLEPRLVRSVENDAEDIDPRGTAPRHAVQDRPQRTDGLVEPGSVEKHKLSAFVSHDAADRVARRLLHRRDDRDLFAHQPVDERRFARVGPADHPDYRDFRHYASGQSSCAISRSLYFWIFCDAVIGKTSRK